MDTFTFLVIITISGLATYLIELFINRCFEYFNKKSRGQYEK